MAEKKLELSYFCRKKVKIHQSTRTLFGINPVATIGSFDGVHCGHRAVIDAVVSSARRLRTQSLVITFDNHPRTVLDNTDRNFELLTLPDEKFDLIRQTHIDHLYILPFTPETAQLTAKEFIKNVLHEEIKVKQLILGYDNKFGKDKIDDLQTLQLIAKEFGIGISRELPVKINSVNVSSTKIRTLLKAGEIEQASDMLGYNYSIAGIVTHGNRIGRKIGFPTANIEIENCRKLIPAIGVYAVEILINDELYRGMLNIGFKPTLSGEKLTAEVHIFDFIRDIYGLDIRIFFKKYIRNEIKFSGIDELKNKLCQDKISIENYFTSKIIRKSNFK